MDRALEKPDLEGISYSTCNTPGSHLQGSASFVRLFIGSEVLGIKR